MLKKNPGRWLLIGWLIAGCLDYLLPRSHSSIHLCDPISSSILISLAISAAVTAGTAGIDYLIAKKQKVSPVDRGRQDDIRISLPGYGESIVWSRGRVRGAPVWKWHTPIVDRPVTTPGHSGGKGPPKPPTPTTIDHQYFTSLAGDFHDGEIQTVRRIWFNSDIVWNTTNQISPDLYEAENAALAGGAHSTTSSIASMGHKVVGIGSGGTVTFSVNIADDGDYDVAIFYLDSVSDLQYEVLVDGVSHGDVACPTTEAGLEGAATIGLSLTTGVRLVQFRNTSAAAPDMDRIEVVETVSFASGSLVDSRIFTNLTDPALLPPSDQTKPWAKYNALPIEMDPGGGGGDGGSPRPGTSTITANLAKYGSPQIRIYRGTLDQPADPAIIADKGVDNTPAWRGIAYIVIDGLLTQSGSIPNVTIEWDQGTTAVDQIVKDLYALGGVADTNLDVTALSGLTIPGVIRTSQKPIGDTLKDLQTRFQFDMVEFDGLVKAALRNRTSIDFVIPFAKLRAHQDGADTPPQDCVITDIDPLLLPFEVDVNYLDPGQDYHNGVQFDRRIDNGFQTDVQSVSLALVDNEHNMKMLASTLLYRPDMEGRSFAFETGPEFFPVIPGAVGQLVLPNATHTVRVGDGKYGLPMGICQFQAVRQAASVYSATGFGAISGAEPPVAGFPSNTKGIILDGPLFRPEDAGDGSDVVCYVGMCGIGGGAWPGAAMYQESPFGSGNYADGLITLASLPSAIGITTGALASVGNVKVWDTTSSLTINFYFDPLLATETVSRIEDNPNLNLIAIKNPITGAVEVVQFKNATPGVASSPFVAQYTIDHFLRGKFGSENNVGSHTAADEVVVIDSTIKPRRFSVQDVSRDLNVKFQTSGQDLDSALVVTEVLRGSSLKVPVPTVAQVGAATHTLVTIAIDNGPVVPFKRKIRLASNAGMTNDLSIIIAPGGYIEVAYNGCLARDPLPAELQTERLLLVAAGHTSDSALCTACKTFVRGLFESAEYVARSRTDDEFINDLYAAYLDRLPDQSGFNFWLAQLIASNRSHLLDSFDADTDFATGIEGKVRALNNPWETPPLAQTVARLVDIVRSDSHTATRAIWVTVSHSTGGAWGDESAPLELIYADNTQAGGSKGEGTAQQIDQYLPPVLNMTTAISKFDHVVNADVVNSTNTFAVLSELSWAVENGKIYEFTIILRLTDSNNEGIKLDLAGGSAAMTWIDAEYFGTDNTSVAISDGVKTALTDVVTRDSFSGMVRITGSFSPSADGTFAPRFAQSAHASGSITARKGSSSVATEAV